MTKPSEKAPLQPKYRLFSAKTAFLTDLVSQFILCREAGKSSRAPFFNPVGQSRRPLFFSFRDLSGPFRPRESKKKAPDLKSEAFCFFILFSGTRDQRPLFFRKEGISRLWPELLLG